MNDLDMLIRPFRGTDLGALLRVWNAALPRDAVTERRLLAQVLLDPNVDEGFLVAEAGGEVIGFVLGIVRREPLPGSDLETERGWITAFGVRPDCQRAGVGTALFEAAFSFFRDAGRREVLISPYAPNYFVPGVDLAAYPAAGLFLERLGFETIARPLSMDANLVPLEVGPEVCAREEALRADGFLVRPLTIADVPEFLRFLAAAMPGDWLRHARELLHRVARGDATYDQITLALQSPDRIVGYAQFEGEHFGPFGVAEGYQGRGLGTVLLARTLERMRQHGHHHAWLLWTSDDAARLYARFGFRETRRFAVMRKRL
jgi:ribosomal protein S18 acetylase RimI-like enzyme